MTWLLRHANALALALGLGGIGYGCWLVYEPMAFLIVGAVLLWMGLPD